MPEVQGDQAGALRAASGGSTRSYVAFAQNSRDEVRIQGDGHISGALAAEPGMKQTTYLSNGYAVRRLTPVECHLLQGFAKNHCAVTYRKKPAADGPIYKALGNSMPVPVIRWLGEQIEIALLY